MKTTSLLALLLVISPIGCKDHSAEIESLKKELAEAKAKAEDYEQRSKLKDEISRVRDVEISGSVFLAMPNGESKKLGLVTVSAHDASEAQSRIKEAKNDVLRRSEEMLSRIVPLNSNVINAIAAFESSEAEYMRLAKKQEAEIDRLVARFNAVSGSSGLSKLLWREPYFDRLKPDTSAKQKAIFNEELQTIEKTDQSRQIAKQNAQHALDSINTSIEAYNTESEPYRELAEGYHKYCISTLQNPIASTKTDADGNFAIKAPKTGKFILTASTDLVFIMVEFKPVWAVLVDEPSRSKVFLSNDNEASTYSTLSVIQRIDLIPMPKRIHRSEKFYTSDLMDLLSRSNRQPRTAK